MSRICNNLQFWSRWSALKEIFFENIVYGLLSKVWSWVKYSSCQTALQNTKSVHFGKLAVTFAVSLRPNPQLLFALTLQTYAPATVHFEYNQHPAHSKFIEVHFPKAKSAICKTKNTHNKSIERKQEQFGRMMSFGYPGFWYIVTLVVPIDRFSGGALGHQTVTSTSCWSPIQAVSVLGGELLD